MPHIAQLAPHVADLIAAGEVVERPASVVKELTENAIDAGAHTVTVEIQHGGMTLIRVTDDGCGIAAEEAPTAFLRHATSKIRNEYDLEAISTLGFRGEALAAIAAVAEVELLTRRAEDALGTSVALAGGELLGQEEAGCPVGTTLMVRNLFYNTPARLKFMKKDQVEAAACLATVQRQALSHPEVAFKYIRDGKQELLTPGDGQLRSAMYAVLGRDMALGFIPVEGSGEDMTVSGFTSLPTCCRGSRGYQFFFVNGRYIKSKTMQAALEQAYANQKMVGKFPGCVLQLSVKTNAVDVNVHPTKQEVKFGNERQVFSAVYYAVLSALGGDKSRPAAAVGTPTPAPAKETYTQTTLPLHDATNVRREDWTQVLKDGAVRPTVPQRPAPTVEPIEKREKGAPGKTEGFVGERRSSGMSEASGLPGAEGYGACSDDVGAGSRPARKEPEGKQERAGLPARGTPHPYGGKAADGWAVEPAPTKGPVYEPPQVDAPAPTAEPVPVSPQDAAPDDTPWRIAGELFHTYVIVEQGERALLIDKHAAHERMNFDRMRAQDYLPMSQTLLTPVVVTPAPEECQLLLDNAGELDRLGFDLSDFGGGSLAVRAVPDYVAVGEIESTLSEIADKLASTGSTGYQERRDELLHTMACKAAIKGGWRSAQEELEAVARAVLSGQVKYCPHGRPVAIELTKKQLEKQFKRS